jgi:ribosome-binding factor A
MERKGGGADDRRIKRVEREIREVIARYLISGFRGELRGIVSVSRVGMAKDLRSGRVFVSVMGDPGDAEASLASLKEFGRDIQAEVDRTLKMKFCPKLAYYLDESMEHVLKVERILRDISEKNSSMSQGASPDASIDDEGDDHE